MSHKRMVILGAKESGTGAAVLAKKQGYDVFVSDSGNIQDDYKKILNTYQIEWEEQTHTEKNILNGDEIIKSPGIPDDVPIIRKIRALNIPVISEIEFASRFTNAHLIGVTGSNGKTTTTQLIYHMFAKAGLNIGLAGNMGKSFARQVAEEQHNYYVLELSSFQLESVYTFRPDLAIVLNITPDHLDRYEYDMNKYVKAKFNIMQNMEQQDQLIYCSDDSRIMEYLRTDPGNVEHLPFSMLTTNHQTAYIKNNQMVINYKNEVMTMNINELSLKGQHNTYNSMAAGIAGRVYELRKETIRESLSDFQGVEHRLEMFLSIRDVQFINDSKATNINSTWYALESMPNNVIWIAGGVDKGNDYSVLSDLVREKVKALVCLGKDNTKLHQAFEGYKLTRVDTQSMEEAVIQAYKLAKKGDTVLLSPACASFDLFDNYEDRGNQFKEAVREL